MLCELYEGVSVFFSSVLQEWPASIAALQRRLRTAPRPSAAGRCEATGPPRRGGGVRTATVSAAPPLIRWAPPPPAALEGLVAAPGPRAPTPAGEAKRRATCVRDRPSPRQRFGGFPPCVLISLSVTRAPFLRYKGRRPECHAPHVPNQPSEAAAHFYFELAKTVLIKAGGNSSTSIFTQPSASGGHQGPHRNLHLCAFEIGLYALGLHNFVSPNWLSRTYSSHVSWITGKARLKATI